MQTFCKSFICNFYFNHGVDNIMHQINFFQFIVKPCQRVVTALLFLLVFAFTHHNAHAEGSVVMEENIFSSTETDDDGLYNLMGSENEEKEPLDADMGLDLTNIDMKE